MKILVDDEYYWADFGHLFSQVICKKEYLGCKCQKNFDRTIMILEEPGVTYEEVEVEEEASSLTSTKKKKKAEVEEEALS